MSDIEIRKKYVMQPLGSASDEHILTTADEIWDENYELDNNTGARQEDINASLDSRISANKNRIDGHENRIEALEEGGGGGGSDKYYRLFTIYNINNSQSDHPALNNAGSITWDANSDSLILNNTGGWENNPKNYSAGQFLWMASATFDSKTRLIANGSNWNFACLTGADGDNGTDGRGVEFIFKRFRSLVDFNNEPTPVAPSGDDTKDDDVPTAQGWADNAQGVTDEYIIEAASIRHSTNGHWGSYSKPFIWSVWSEDGIDGAGIEYIFYCAAESDVNAENELNSAIWAPIPTTPEAVIAAGADYQKPDWPFSTGHDYNWSDDAASVSAENPYQFVMIRKFDGEKWGPFCEPKLWGLWGQKTVTIVEPSDTYYKMYTCYAFTRSETSLKNYTVETTIDWSTATQEQKDEFYANPLNYIRTLDPDQLVAQITWHDTVPSGSGALYLITNRIGDENSMFDQGWTQPMLWGDRADFQVEYTADAEKGAILYNNPAAMIQITSEYIDENGEFDEIAWRAAMASADKGVWDDEVDQPVYMATSKLRQDGTWTNWSVSWIKGEKGEKGDPGQRGENGQAGVDGKDGNEVEYIYRVFAKDSSDIIIDSSGYYRINNPSVLPPMTQAEIDEISNYQTPDWYPGNGQPGWDRNWTDDPLGVTAGIPYEFISERKKIDEVWGPFSQPVLWAKFGEKGDTGSKGDKGDTGVSTFTSFIFTRCPNSIDLSGTYLSDDIRPANVQTYTDQEHTHRVEWTEGGVTKYVEWHDTIPVGTGKVWMSTNIINDGAIDQGWTSPTKIGDTSTLQQEFCAKEDIVKQLPDLNLPAYHADNPETVDEDALRAYMLNTYQETWGDEDDITAPVWMAMTYCQNGKWNPWAYFKIKGEKGDKGDDGTSFKTIGTGTINDANYDCGQNGLGVWFYNRPAEDCVLGNVFMLQRENSSGITYATEIWAWTGEHAGENPKYCDPTNGIVNGWVRVGNMTSSSAYIHIKYANHDPNGTYFESIDDRISFTPEVTEQEEVIWALGEFPGKYVGLYTDAVKEDSLDITKYTWAKWSGDDGWGLEEIFILSPNKPTQPSKANANYVSVRNDGQWVNYPKGSQGFEDNFYKYDAIPSVNNLPLESLPEWSDLPLEPSANSGSCWYSVRNTRVDELKEWSDPIIFTPYVKDGRDSDSDEFVYLRTAKDVNTPLVYYPAESGRTTDFAQSNDPNRFNDNYYPYAGESGGARWTDQPTGVTSTQGEEWEWCAQRHKDGATGKWGAFTVSQYPSWRYAADGTDGHEQEYIFGYIIKPEGVDSMRDLVTEEFCNALAAWLKNHGTIPPGEKLVPTNETDVTYIEVSNHGYHVQWQDDSDGLESEKPIELFATRSWDENTGDWGDYSNPKIWNYIGFNGEDGGGIEYIFAKNNTEDTAPTISDEPYGGKTPADPDFVPSGWNDDLIAADENNKFVWASKRKYVDRTNFENFSTPVIWSRYTTNGQSGLTEHTFQTIRYYLTDDVQSFTTPFSSVYESITTNLDNVQESQISLVGWINQFNSLGNNKYCYKDTIIGKQWYDINSNPSGTISWTENVELYSYANRGPSLVLGDTYRSIPSTTQDTGNLLQQLYFTSNGVEQIIHKVYIGALDNAHLVATYDPNLDRLVGNDTNIILYQRNPGITVSVRCADDAVNSRKQLRSLFSFTHPDAIPNGYYDVIFYVEGAESTDVASAVLRYQYGNGAYYKFNHYGSDSIERTTIDSTTYTTNMYTVNIEDAKNSNRANNLPVSEINDLNIDVYFDEWDNSSEYVKSCTISIADCSFVQDDQAYDVWFDTDGNRTNDSNDRAYSVSRIPTNSGSTYTYFSVYPNKLGVCLDRIKYVLNVVNNPINLTPIAGVEQGNLEINVGYGVQGPKGDTGAPGAPGANGLGIVATALQDNSGYHLEYTDGTSIGDVINGANGSNGNDGNDGQSAEVVLENGNIVFKVGNVTKGTLSFDSDGAGGTNIKLDGTTVSHVSKGTDGQDGHDGQDGSDGETPTMQTVGGVAKISLSGTTTVLSDLAQQFIYYRTENSTSPGIWYYNGSDNNRTTNWTESIESSRSASTAYKLFPYVQAYNMHDPTGSAAVWESNPQQVDLEHPYLWMAAREWNQTTHSWDGYSAPVLFTKFYGVEDIRTISNDNNAEITGNEQYTTYVIINSVVDISDDIPVGRTFKVVTKDNNSVSLNFGNCEVIGNSVVDAKGWNIGGVQLLITEANQLVTCTKVDANTWLAMA